MDLDKYGPVPARDYDYVVCSKCGSEFQPHIKECIDCGAPTVPPGTALPRARVREDERETEMPPLSQDPELFLLSTGSFETVEDLQEALEEEGIPAWIEPQSAGPHANSFQLYARRRDFRRARELERELIQEAIPEGEERFIDIPVAGICPVCKTSLPTGALECPGCGLVLAQEPPSTVENVGIVQSFYEALAAHDEARVLGILHPDVEWVQNEGFPGGGSYVGAETVRNEVFLRLAEDWDGWQAGVGRWLNAGDSVIALGAYRGTCRKTGKSMQAAFAHVYWLEEGRIVRFEQYADTAKIAEACADD